MIEEKKAEEGGNCLAGHDIGDARAGGVYDDRKRQAAGI